MYRPFHSSRRIKRRIIVNYTQIFVLRVPLYAFGGKAKGGKARSGLLSLVGHLDEPLIVKRLFARSKPATDVIEKNYCIVINLLCTTLIGNFYLSYSILRNIHISFC